MLNVTIGTHSYLITCPVHLPTYLSLHLENSATYFPFFSYLLPFLSSTPVLPPSPPPRACIPSHLSSPPHRLRGADLPRRHWGPGVRVLPQTQHAAAHDVHRWLPQVRDSNRITDIFLSHLVIHFFVLLCLLSLFYIFILLVLFLPIYLYSNLKYAAPVFSFLRVIALLPSTAADRCGRCSWRPLNSSSGGLTTSPPWASPLKRLLRRCADTSQTCASRTSQTPDRTSVSLLKYYS